MREKYQYMSFLLCVMETIATGAGCVSFSSLVNSGAFHVFWFLCTLICESIKLGL